MRRVLQIMIFFCITATSLHAQVGNVPTFEPSKVVEEFRVFPNPSSQTIKVTNSELVKRLEIYDIFGKNIKTFINSNNAQHDVSDLRPGLYWVKIIGDKNKIFKTVKLNRTYDGP